MESSEVGVTRTIMYGEAAFKHTALNDARKRDGIRRCDYFRATGRPVWDWEKELFRKRRAETKNAGKHKATKRRTAKKKATKKRAKE